MLPKDNYVSIYDVHNMSIQDRQTDWVTGRYKLTNRLSDSMADRQTTDDTD